jgi:hypothetical protein
VAAFLVALFEVSRRKWWGDLGRLLLAAVSVELLIVVADMVLGARAGAFLDADARVHLARIRFLIDHGFSNYDPYIAVSYFFPTYHTNILHALYASCSQLTGVDYLGVWFASLPWGKLLAASGVYYLVWCIFECRWAAWLAVVSLVGILGPTSFIIYPNQLAPWWLMPCMIGFVIQAIRSPCPWACCARLGVGSLLLGQVHGLFAGIAFLVLAPVLGAMALFKIVRRRADRWRVSAGLLFAAVGLIFPLVSRMYTAPPSPEGKTETTRAAEAAAEDFVEFDNGWVMLDPRRSFFDKPWRLPVLALALAAGLVSRHRRRAACVVAVVVLAAAALYVPPVCTALVWALGEEWIVRRLGFLLRLGLHALLVPALACWIAPHLRWWWARAPIGLAVFGLFVLDAGQTGQFTWKTYREKAFAPREKRQARLTQFRGVRDFLKSHLPPGETVLIEQSPGMGLVTLYDCYIVAAESSNNGVTDLAQRRQELRDMLIMKTPWLRRRELLHKYGMRYFILYNTPGRWAPPRTQRRWSHEGMTLLLLNTD